MGERRSHHDERSHACRLCGRLQGTTYHLQPCNMHPQGSLSSHGDQATGWRSVGESFAVLRTARVRSREGRVHHGVRSPHSRPNARLIRIRMLTASTRARRLGCLRLTTLVASRSTPCLCSTTGEWATAGRLVGRIRACTVSVRLRHGLAHVLPVDSTSAMADDVVTLFNYIGWTENRQIHVVGVSLGGMIAQGLIRDATCCPTLKLIRFQRWLRRSRNESSRCH